MTRPMLYLTVLCSLFTASASELNWEDYILGGLRFLVDRSDLVVVAQIVDEPIRHNTVIGPFQYNCKISIKRVMKGDKQWKGKEIEVGLLRIEKSAKDRHPLITKDARCMLFLKHELGEGFVKWISADPWLGVQYPSSVMADALAQLAEQEGEQTVEQKSAGDATSPRPDRDVYKK